MRVTHQTSAGGVQLMADVGGVKVIPEYLVGSSRPHIPAVLTPLRRRHQYTMEPQKYPYEAPSSKTPYACRGKLSRSSGQKGEREERFVRPNSTF